MDDEIEEDIVNEGNKDGKDITTDQKLLELNTKVNIKEDNITREDVEIEEDIMMPGTEVEVKQENGNEIEVDMHGTDFEINEQIIEEESSSVA